jgi:hypothetical protein
MSARSGMANIILTLRGLCDASTADATIGTVAYWSDNQLQDILDMHRIDIWREPLAIIETYAGSGTIQYLDYQSEYTNWEETTGGSEIFIVEDSDGDFISSDDYSVDYPRGHITFDADTLGTVYYLTGRTYDLNAAASDVWTRKAGLYASSFSFSTDNHRIDKGALINNAMRMASFYASKSAPFVTTIYRGDIDDTAIER